MAKAALLYKLFGQVLIFLNEDFVLLLTCKMIYCIPTQHIYGIAFILCCLYYWYFYLCIWMRPDCVFYLSVLTYVGVLDSVICFRIYLNMVSF
jgi:hypothetical protein